MFGTVWKFLEDASNQSVLKMLASGLATLAAGTFAVCKLKKSGNGKSLPLETQSEPLKSVNIANSDNNFVNNKINGSSINIQK